MTIIKKAAFAGNIQWLKTRGEEFEQRLRDSMAFIAYCGLKDGNTTPSTQWADAGLPKWMAAMGASAAQKKDKKLNPEQCAERAEEIANDLVSRTLAAEERKRERAKASREAAKAKREAAEVAAKAPSVGEGATSKQPAPPKTSASAGKPDAPEPRKVEPEERYTIGHYNTPTGADEIVHLTAEEYEAAMKLIADMRKPAKPRKTA